MLYGLGSIFLGLLMICLGMRARSRMSGTRVGTSDVLSGRRRPEEARGQFDAYGRLLIGGLVLIVIGIGIMVEHL